MPDRAARGTRRPLPTRLAFLLAGLVLAFALAEAGFRVADRVRLARAGELWAVYDETLGWRPNPAYGDHNELGLRDRPVGEKGDRRRILFLGDSVLYYGDDVDDTVVGRLRAHLEGEAGPEAPDVVNAGVKGYTNWQELQYLKLRGLQVRPDVVGVAFVLNDCYRMLHQFRVEDGRIVGQAYDFSQEAVGGEPWLNRVLRKSRLLVWIRHRLASFEPVPEGGYTFDHRPDFRAAWQDEPWTAIESQMREMTALGEQHGFRVFLVAFPFADQYREDYLARDRDHVLKPQRELGRICGELGIPWLDLRPVLDPATDFLEDRIHLSRTGREKAAAAIASFLRTEGLLGDR